MAVGVTVFHFESNESSKPKLPILCFFQPAPPINLTHDCFLTCVVVGNRQGLAAFSQEATHLRGRTSHTAHHITTGASIEIGHFPGGSHRSFLSFWIRFTSFGDINRYETRRHTVATFDRHRESVTAVNGLQDFASSTISYDKSFRICISHLKQFQRLLGLGESKQQ